MWISVLDGVGRFYRISTRPVEVPVEVLVWRGGDRRTSGSVTGTRSRLLNLAFEEVERWGPTTAVLAIANAAEWDEESLKAMRQRSGRMLEDVRKVLEVADQSLPARVHQAIVGAHVGVRDGSLQRWVDDSANALRRGDPPAR